MKIKLNDMTGFFLLFKNNSFLIDFKQYEKFNNDNYCWNEEMDIMYPTYNKTQNIKENLIEYFYTKLYDVMHINNNIYDLRECNCKLMYKKTKYDEYIRQKYNVIDYIQGHNRTNSANILYNMVWIITGNTENVVDTNVYYMMYCEKDTLIKLTQEQYEQIVEYNKTINYNLTWFLSIREDTLKKNIIAKYNNTSIYLNKIIKSFNMKNIVNLNTNIIEHKNKLFDNIDKNIREKYNVINIIKGHTKSRGQKAHIERNQIWVLDTHYIMACEKDTLVKLCKNSYEKILDFENKNNVKITWHKLENGYIGSTQVNLYMHQIIMDCHGNGKGTHNISVDHIDQDPTNNMMSNLRIAIREEQEDNSKGIKEGTKRARKHNARPLPDGLTHEMLPKYVVYYKECYNKEKSLYREFFKIEKHPKLDKIWMSSKSNNIPLLDKLESVKQILISLE
jgi:hypothetical protein